MVSVPPRAARVLGVALVGVPLVTLAACAGGGPGERAGPAPSPPPRGPSPGATDGQDAADGEVLGQEVLRLDFDEGVRPTPGAPYTVAATRPRAIDEAPGVGAVGLSLRFPGPCPAARRAACPRAFVEVPDAPALNPHARDFRFGASVRLETPATSTGANVMQKGFSTDGASQWKLQIDDRRGRPSCVLVGQGAPTVHEARSEVGVADGRWHQVRCTRRQGELVVSVDGVERGRVGVPAGVALANTAPVRLGAKSLKPDNDQFTGLLDDAFLQVADR